MSGPGRRAEGRSVTIVVCDDTGSLLGSLGPFDVATPWWQDLEPIRCRFPMLTVLRLLHGTPSDGGAFGGQVTYLAESGRGLTGLSARLPVDPAALADHPHRMPWARPGGPAWKLQGPPSSTAPGTCRASGRFPRGIRAAAGEGSG